MSACQNIVNINFCGKLEIENAMTCTINDGHADAEANTAAPATVDEDMVANFRNEIAQIDNICKHCGYTTGPMCCGNPVIVEIKRYIIRRKIKYRGLILAIIALAFLDEGILFAITSMFAQQNHSMHSNTTMVTNKSHNIALNLMNMTEELYIAKNDSEFDLDSIALSTPINDTKNPNATFPPPLNGDIIMNATKKIDLISCLCNENVTDHNNNIRDLMFYSKFDNLKQFETTAIYFFGNQLLKGLLIPAVMAEIAAVGFHTPFYKGTFFLFWAMILYMYAAWANYPMWLLILCTLFYSAGSAFTSVSSFCILAQLFPEEEQRSKVLSLVFTSHAVGILYGLYFSNEMIDNFWNIYVWIGLFLGFIMMLGCVGMYHQLVIKAKKCLVKIIHVSHNHRKVLRINNNKTIMYMFFAIQVASFNMKNLESTLNIWTIPFLKYCLHQTSFTYIPNVIGFMFGTLLCAPFVYRLRHMHVFFLIMMFNGLMTIMLPFATTMTQFIQLQTALGISNGIMTTLKTIYLSILAHEQISGRLEHHYIFCYFYGIAEMMSVGGHLLGTVGIEVYSMFFSMGIVLLITGLSTCSFGLFGICKFNTLRKDDILF